MSTRCTCRWEKVQISTALDPLVLCVAVREGCPFPGHTDDASDG